MEEVCIRLRSQINRDWSDWFTGFTVDNSQPGETVLSGTIPDQAALYGLMDKLSDLGIQIISVFSKKIPANPPEEVMNTDDHISNEVNNGFK
jgi:hypothetical protein